MSLFLLCLLLQDPPVPKEMPSLGPGEKLIAQVDAAPGVVWSLLGIAPDGTAAAWREFKGGKFSLVWNGGRVDGLDKVDPVCLWKEKNVPVFKVGKDGKAWIIEGATFLEGFESVGDPILSPSRKVVGYVAREGKSVYVVNGNNKTTVLAAQEQTLAFAHDDQRFIVATFQTTTGSTTNSALLGNDFKEIKGLLGGGPAGPVAFSPDGVMAYTLLGGGTVQTTAGFTGPSFDKVAGLRFAGDGKTVGYLAEAKEGNKSKKFVVVNGVPGPTKYDDAVGYPGLSRDGKVAAFIAKKAGKWVVAQDTKFSDAFDAIRPRIGDVDQPVVSLDGRSIGFTAEKAGKTLLVVNNRVVSEEQSLSAPVLNFSGSTVSFGYVSKQSVIWKTVAIPGR